MTDTDIEGLIERLGDCLYDWSTIEDKYGNVEGFSPPRSGRGSYQWIESATDEAATALRTLKAERDKWHGEYLAASDDCFVLAGEANTAQSRLLKAVEVAETVAEWLNAVPGGRYGAIGELNRRKVNALLELVQAQGCTAGEAAKLVEYAPGPTILRQAAQIEALKAELSQLRAQAADREKTNFERGAPALVMVLHGAIRQFLDEQYKWFETHGIPVKFGASFGAINRLQKVYDDTNIQAAMWGEFIPPRAQAAWRPDREAVMAIIADLIRPESSDERNAVENTTDRILALPPPPQNPRKDGEAG